jgi:hypothetical protein
VQKRVLCAFGQPTTGLVIGPLPHTGQAPSDGAADPDGSIDVDDPDGDCQHGRRRVDDGRPALLLDDRLEPQQVLEIAEARFPQSDARHQQRSYQHELRPEHEFLAGIVLADLRQVLVVAVSTWRMRATHTKSVNSGRFCQKKRMDSPRKATASNRPSHGWSQRTTSPPPNRAA